MLNLKNILFLFILASIISINADCTYAKVRIAILYSELSEKAYSENSKSNIDAITSWEIFLMQNKIPYEVIYNNDLESGIEDEFDILILPSIEIISKAELEELQNFLNSGKSIINSGSKLRFIGDNNFNFRNLKILFGIKNIDVINAESTSFLHSIVPNNLNYFSTDDFQNLLISNRNKPLACDINRGTNSTCGYLNIEQMNSKSSLVFGVMGRGKYLFSGFDINDIIGGTTNLNQFGDLILETISWMDFEPNVYLNYSFDENDKAVILTLKYNNSLEPELVELLMKNNFNPYLILDPQLKISQEILKQFDTDKIILDLSLLQEDKLDYNTFINIISLFEKENELTVKTIILGESFIKSNYLDDLKYKGIDNILYFTGEAKSARFEKNGLFIVPFNNKLNFLARSGQIYFFNYSPKHNCNNSKDSLLESLNDIDYQQFKFTNLEHISNWWRNKNNLDVKILSINNKKIEIIVNNRNSESIYNLPIFLNLNNDLYENNLSVTSNNLVVEHYFEKISGAVVITLSIINANSSNKVIINFN